MIMGLMSLNLLFSMLFISMKHPLSTGLILLMQTIAISLLSGNLYQNFWFSYILFLVMVGGMLVLFMYMTSIASNEKFKTNLKLMMIMPIPLMVSIMVSKIFNFSLSTSETTKMNTTYPMEMMLNKFINFPMMLLMMFLMMYLLIAMIATVKITTFKQGSIRQMS